MTRSVPAPSRTPGGGVPDLVSTVGSRPNRTNELILATGALAMLAVVIPFTVVDWGRNDATSLNIALVLTVVLVAAVRLSIAFGSGRPDLLRTFFYLFVYIFFGIAATAQIVSGRYTQDARSYAADIVTQGLVAVLVGIAAYEVGWYAWNRRVGLPRADVPVAPRVRWYFSQRRVVLLGLFGLAATVYQVTQNGLTSFFLSRSDTTGLLTGSEFGNTFYQSSDKTSGLLTVFLTQVPLFVALFLYLYCRHHRLWPAPRNLVTDALGKFLVVLLVVGNIIINNPIGNARFWFLLIAVSVVSVYLPYTRATAVRTYIALALAVLLLVFTALDAFRNTERADFSLSGPGTSLVTDETYGMFQMELNGVEYIESKGYTDGNQLLGSLFTFIPRSIWESKPIATGQLIDPKYVRASPMWTEFQVDFGLIGIAIGFLLVGAGSAALTRRAAGAAPGVLHAILPLTAVYQIFPLRGSLLPAVGHLYQLVVVVVLAIGFQRLDRPGSDAVTAPSARTGTTSQ